MARVVRRETVRDLLAEGRTDWDVSGRMLLVITSIPFVLPLVTVVAAVGSRQVFDTLTGEDFLGEWIQVVAWLVALVFAAGVGIRYLRRGQYLLATLYFIVAAAIVFIVGEEVSWGQRIFGFETPEGLEEVNRQGETNLHNIYGVQTVFSWGMWVVGLYGTALPIWAWRRWGSYRHWPDSVAALVPHWLLVPYFLLLLVWRTYRNLFEPIEDLYYGISQFGEITELILALGILAFMWHRWRATRADLP